MKNQAGIMATFASIAAVATLATAAPAFAGGNNGGNNGNNGDDCGCSQPSGPSGPQQPPQGGNTDSQSSASAAAAAAAAAQAKAQQQQQQSTIVSANPTAIAQGGAGGAANLNVGAGALSPAATASATGVVGATIAPKVNTTVDTTVQPKTTVDTTIAPTVNTKGGDISSNGGNIRASATTVAGSQTIAPVQSNAGNNAYYNNVSNYKVAAAGVAVSGANLASMNTFVGCQVIDQKTGLAFGLGTIGATGSIALPSRGHSAPDQDCNKAMIAHEEAMQALIDAREISVASITAKAQVAVAVDTGADTTCELKAAATGKELGFSDAEIADQKAACHQAPPVVPVAVAAAAPPVVHVAARVVHHRAAHRPVDVVAACRAAQATALKYCPRVGS